MVKRQDIIFEKVKELSLSALEHGEEPGVTAIEMSELLQMDRGNVSKEMNLLAAAGKLMKRQGRPVEFSESMAYEEYQRQQKEKIAAELESNSLERADRENETEIGPSFQNMIGQSGSLKMQIKQVKAAMLYPPHGLHTMLNGPTGTGKTLFAQQMYEYAKHMEMLEPEAELVTFNCAEYAENAQLIVSQIFGHKKGAFTGAEKDKPGLIERASGGILFLDEIHRLPPEGQEMLFSLMDHGTYRRLGETERNRTADVLIIGATTENLDTSLLKTFLRRMPVTIQLPPLNERPLLERLEMIEQFLTQEQKKIFVSIKVSKEVILSLLLYECTGNVGQLRSDIQLLCARAFWEYKVGGSRVMELERRILPFYIEQGLFRLPESKNSLLHFLENGDNHYIFPVNGETGESKQDIISKKYRIYHKFYSDKKETEPDKEIRSYITSMIERENEDRRVFSRDALNKVVTGKVYYAVEEAVEFAEMRLKRELSDNIKIGFALHINALVEGMDKKQNIREEKLQQIVRDHPKEAKVAKLILRILEEELNIRFKKGELGYTIMFLCADEEEREHKKIGLIVIAHGEYTATSIAEAANALLGTEHCKGINMPLNENVEDVYKQTLKKVVEVNEGRGAILLVDMGSLNMFAERIEEESGIPVKSVGMVSMLLVLEAVRKCTTGEETLSQVAEYLEQMLVRMVKEQKQQKLNKQYADRPVILVTCMSGMGAARKIEEMVRAITGLEEDGPVQLCCVGADGLDSSGAKLGGHLEKELLAVVGTADLHLEGIPYISVDEIVAGAGIERLEKIVNRQKSDLGSVEKNGRKIDERVLVTAMKELLEFLDAEKLVSLVLPGFYECVKNLDIKEQESKIVRYTIHVGCMVERLMRREVLPYQDVEQYQQSHMREFEIVSKAVSALKGMFNLEVPASEIAYIVELLCE